MSTYMLFTYPPQNPCYNEDVFYILEAEINQFKTLGNIVVCGELNIRTEEKADIINIQGDQHLGLPGETCLPLPELPQRQF